ncbi:MAG: PAS domain S-box protein [Acidobacteriota bacterium]
MDTFSPDTRCIPGQPQADSGSLGRLNPGQLRLFFDTMVQGVAYCKMVYDGDTPVDFTYVDVNPAFANLTGLENVTGRAVSEVIPGIRERDPGLLAIYGRVARGGPPERFEYHLESLGQWFSLAAFCPQPGYFVAVFDVITERKRTEQALRVSEERLRFALEGANDGLWDVNMETGAVYMSPRGCAILGYDPAEMECVARSWKDLVSEEDMPLTMRRLEDYLEGRSPLFEVEQRLKTKSGELKWVLTRGKASRLDDHGRPSRMTGTHTDITERKRTEQALRESESRYRLLIESAGDAIYVSDSAGRLVDVNARALEQTGYTREELLGLCIGDVDPEYRRQPEIPSLEDLSSAGGGIFQTTHRRKDGTAYPVEVRVAVLDLGGKPHFMGIARDTSERRQMQEALIQSEKMMSVGGLAAGMAHEINNPLGGILQNVQVIRRRLSDASAQNHQAAQEAGCPWESIGRFMEARGIFRFLDSIQEAGSRAAKIVNSMLEFSRKSDAAHDWADINELLECSVVLCSTDYSLKKKYDFRKIAIERDYAPGLPRVMCSKSKIQQVFMNILGNAAHALAGAPSPRITLRTRGAGEWVRIELEDNGPGMDENTRRKAFEPFFTTKPVGEGTGLGLSISYFIVTSNHRGTIEVDSEPGKGARFLIRLPVSAETRESASKP